MTTFKFIVWFWTGIFCAALIIPGTVLVFSAFFFEHALFSASSSHNLYAFLGGFVMVNLGLFIGNKVLDWAAS